MKKFILMLIALVTVAFTFTSCGDDDNVTGDISINCMAYTKDGSGFIATEWSKIFAEKASKKLTNCSYTANSNSLIVHDYSKSEVKSALTKVASEIADAQPFDITDADHYELWIEVTVRQLEDEKINYYFKTK